LKTRNLISHVSYDKAGRLTFQGFAYQLAKRGLKVALVEKGYIGDGPTGKSSAIIRQHYSNDLTARMALHSLGIFQNFEDKIGDTCGFRRTGFVALVAAKDQAGLEANVKFQRGLGIKTEVISPEDLGEILPGLETTDLVAAAYEPESGYADAYLATNAYAQAAKRLRTSIFVKTNVEGIRFEGDRVAGIDSSKVKLDAPKILCCTGAWTAAVAKMVGVDAPINACRVQVAYFRRLDGSEAQHPVVVDFINASYFRSEVGNLTLAGLVDPSEANAIVDPDNYNEGLEYEFVPDVGQRLVRRFPAMERAGSAGGYASLYAVTPDWHPVVDEVPEGSGFYICSGFSGHGFKLGPAVGEMVADLVLGERNPEFDAHLFRLSRYQENDLIRGKYEHSIVG
jgi:glycine/D-amino acid oxidase-like deaminating enzyme